MELFWLFWSEGSFGASLAFLEQRLLMEPLWLFWSGGSSSEPLRLFLERRLLLEPFWLLWSGGSSLELVPLLDLLGWELNANSD